MNMPSSHRGIRLRRHLMPRQSSILASSNSTGSSSAAKKNNRPFYHASPARLASWFFLSLSALCSFSFFHSQSRQYLYRQARSLRVLEGEHSQLRTRNDIQIKLAAAFARNTNNSTFHRPTEPLSSFPLQQEPMALDEEDDDDSSNDERPFFAESWYIPVHLVDNGHHARMIDPNDYELYEHYVKTVLEALDVKPKGFLKRLRNDEDYYEGGQAECRRPTHRGDFHENCNIVHEFSLDRGIENPLQDFDTTQVGSGTYRDVWVAEGTIDAFALKTIQLEFVYGNAFIHGYYYQMHNDAIVMERLTSSPRIVDIYGHCGLTIVSERLVSTLENEMVQKVAGHKRGFMTQTELDKYQEHDVHPFNNYTLSEKVHVALQMAEAMADLHGYEEGAMIHGDVQLVQWLRSETGSIKLNDFNFAQILDFNVDKNEYCTINRCYGGSYQAPEDFRCMQVHEESDVYMMGHVIYSVLTGLFPFYEYSYLHSEEMDRMVQKKVVEEKATPYVDPRYRTRSFVESRLVEIMEQCWEWDPFQRLSIFDVVLLLSELKMEVAAKQQ